MGEPMHIVLITHYFPPEVNAPAQRAYDHARAWVEAGHDVTIVTACPSHPYGDIYDGYENRTQEVTVDGIRVLRLKTTLGPNSGFAKRAINYASFLLATTLNRHRVGKADVVISTSPHFLSGLAGFPVSRLSAAKWVFEVRDIWPESIVAVGAARPGLVVKGLGLLADWAYRTCDRIVSVSPAFSDHFDQRGVPNNKVSVIPNGIATDLEPIDATWDEFPQLARLQGRFVAAYIGTFGMAHSTMTIVEAADQLREQPEIGFLLVGSGAENEVLRRRVAELKLPNLIVLDQQPRSEVLKLWGLVDASIVHLKDQPTFRSVIPTKMLEGMAMGKPIIIGVPGQAQSIVEEAGGGIAFQPEDASDLARAVSELAADKQRACRLAEAGRTFVQKAFDRQKMAQLYLDTLDHVVSSS